MGKPVIALLTDFGTTDHYVGTMKGVAIGICPDVTFIDITLDIDRHDTLGAAIALAAAYRYFPSGTVFLVVVDPGVGSARRALAVEAGGFKFVAPDNGVLTAVLGETAPRKLVELTERRFARPTLSRTFEGRDRFGPAAAWLAKGIDLTALGRPVHDWVRLDIPTPVVNEAEVIGEVLRVDRFGNLVTNIDRRTFDRFAAAGAVTLSAGAHGIERVVETYADVDVGALCGLFGSSDQLEIAVNGGSAAERIHAGRGAAVSVTHADRGRVR